MISHSKIIFGGASLSGSGGGYGFGDITKEEAQELVLFAYENGIKTFDTAPIYGFNQSEVNLGLSLKNIREDVQIISKAGVSWHENNRVNMSNDPKLCQKMLDTSLKNLRTEYIDLYMVHWPDKRVDIRKTLEVFQNNLEAGKIMSIGLCNTTNDELKKAAEVCMISSVQCEVNLFNNQIEPLLFSGRTMGWGTFDKGILSGSVDLNRQFEKSDCRSWAPWWKKSNWKDKVKKVKYLNEFVTSEGHSLIEFALAYSLVMAQVDSAICGFKNSQQLTGILNALKHLPDIEQIKQAKRILE